MEIKKVKGGSIIVGLPAMARRLPAPAQAVLLGWALKVLEDWRKGELTGDEMDAEIHAITAWVESAVREMEK